jgi:hypothetical protein
VNASAGLPVPRIRRSPLIRFLASFAAAAAALILVLPSRAGGSVPPPWFVEQALCVHSGWHYTSHRVRGRRPEYVLFGHGFWRTWDVPDSIAGGSGEGGWSTVNGYGGGMQFTLGTWNNAARWSGGSGAVRELAVGDRRVAAARADLGVVLRRVASRVVGGLAADVEGVRAALNIVDEQELAAAPGARGLRQLPPHL